VLCPGPVATNIAASITSFGPEAGTRGPGTQFTVKFPGEVGEMVVDAILANRFMLPTDQQVLAILERRAHDWDGFVEETITSWDEPSTPSLPQGASK
jgi:hypothetical protein